MLTSRSRVHLFLIALFLGYCFLFGCLLSFGAIICIGVACAFRDPSDRILLFCRLFDGLLLCCGRCPTNSWGWSLEFWSQSLSPHASLLSFCHTFGGRHLSSWSSGCERAIKQRLIWLVFTELFKLRRLFQDSVGILYQLFIVSLTQFIVKVDVLILLLLSFLINLHHNYVFILIFWPANWLITEFLISSRKNK